MQKKLNRKYSQLSKGFRSFVSSFTILTPANRKGPFFTAYLQKETVCYLIYERGQAGLPFVFR